MKKKTTIINGRKIIYGKGTPEEVESLNIEKSFKSALKTLNAIRKDMELLLYGRPASLEKTIHGKRKVS